jgi:hypothetical protein
MVKLRRWVNLDGTGPVIDSRASGDLPVGRAYLDKDISSSESSHWLDHLIQGRRPPTGSDWLGDRLSGAYRYLKEPVGRKCRPSVLIVHINGDIETELSILQS